MRAGSAGSGRRRPVGRIRSARRAPLRRRCSRSRTARAGRRRGRATSRRPPRSGSAPRPPPRAAGSTQSALEPGAAGPVGEQPGTDHAQPAPAVDRDERDLVSRRRRRAATTRPRTPAGRSRKSSNRDANASGDVRSARSRSSRSCVRLVLAQRPDHGRPAAGARRRPRRGRSPGTRRPPAAGGARARRASAAARQGRSGSPRRADRRPRPSSAARSRRRASARRARGR